MSELDRAIEWRDVGAVRWIRRLLAREGFTGRRGAVRVTLEQAAHALLHWGP